MKNTEFLILKIKEKKDELNQLYKKFGIDPPVNLSTFQAACNKFGDHFAKPALKLLFPGEPLQYNNADGLYSPTVNYPDSPDTGAGTGTTFDNILGYLDQVMQLGVKGYQAGQNIGIWGNDTNQSTDPNATPTYYPTTPNPNQNNNSGSSNLMLYIGIGAAVFFMIMMLFMVMMAKK